MHLLDEQIKDYFEHVVPMLPEEGLKPVPSTEEFCRFLLDRLEGKDLDDFLDYLKAHPEAQKMITRARNMLNTVDQAERQKVPSGWKRQAKDLVLKQPNVRCPHCGKSITPFKKPIGRQNIYNILWLLAATVSFLASFYYRRYFYQCLALALFFGVKWIFDRKATRTQILIYKALKDDLASVHSRDLHNPLSHL